MKYPVGLVIAEKNSGGYIPYGTKENIMITEAKNV